MDMEFAINQELESQKIGYRVVRPNDWSARRDYAGPDVQYLRTRTSGDLGLL
jgi:hypothetical protein